MEYLLVCDSVSSLKDTREPDLLLITQRVESKENLNYRVRFSLAIKLLNTMYCEKTV